MTLIRQQQLMDSTHDLLTTELEGNFQIRTDFIPKYVCILNNSGAKVYIKDGELMTKPSDALPVNSEVSLSLSIREANVYTIFWEAPAFLSYSNNQLIVRFSDQPIFLQGGKMSGADAVGRTEIVGIPTVNVGGIIDTRIVSSLPTGSNAIGSVKVTDMPPIVIPPAEPKTYVDMQQFQVAISALIGGGFDQDIPCYEIFVQAPMSNTGIVRYGFAAAQCYVELAAGAGAILPVDNLNKLFFVGTVPADKVTVQVGS